MSGHNPQTINPGSDFGHLLNSSNHNSTSVSSHHGHVVNSSGLQNGNSDSNNKPKKVPPPSGKKTKGRVKIKMEFIDNKLRRYTTFSKRKTGIMKKAYELSTLTGTQVMLLVASETGHVYTFATRKLQPMITSEAGKALIQTCLNSPDPANSGNDSQRMSTTGYEETELTYVANNPNGSEPEEEDIGKDTESCSEGSEDSKDVPALLPLSKVPPNFAALLANATAAGLGVKGCGGSS